MIEIVEGYASDIASIMPVMDDAFDPSFGEAWTAAQCLAALAMPDCALILAKDAAEVVGFAISRWVLETEELLMIGVIRSASRRKIGSLLLEKVVHSANSAHRLKLFIEVRDGNDAQSFYAASNFQVIGRRKQYYRGSNGFRPDAITMALDL